MEKKYFIWDKTIEGLALADATKDENVTNKVRKRKVKIHKSKIYFPHKHLILNFKETLSYTEQIKFQKFYERKRPSIAASSADNTEPKNDPDDTDDVVRLQDVKNLTLYLLVAPINRELVDFLHLPLIDRFLRALVVYLEHFTTTWTELSEKRTSSARRLSNPLAGGGRLRRAEEMSALRCLLGREYADLLVGCQNDAARYHHAGAGRASYVRSRDERDIRIFEILLQFAHRVAWIALGRKHKQLIEVEIHRLFKTEAFNTAKRKFTECEVPEDERWILYGPKLPARRKMLRNSPLPYEILNTDCDYRLLSIGLKNIKSQDPRIAYLENALLANEDDLSRLGIKIGILGLPRSNYDVMLIPQASEEEPSIVEESSAEKDEEADDYKNLMPVSGLDDELSKPFPMIKLPLSRTGDDGIRESSRRMWMTYSVRCTNL